MSELTPCNHCTLKRIRRRAEKEGKKVTLVGNRGWTTAYVHPKDIDIKTLSAKQREPYFAASFMALTDYCCC